MLYRVHKLRSETCRRGESHELINLRTCAPSLNMVKRTLSVQGRCNLHAKNFVLSKPSKVCSSSIQLACDCFEVSIVVLKRRDARATTSRPFDSGARPCLLFSRAVLVHQAVKHEKLYSYVLFLVFSSIDKIRCSLHLVLVVLPSLFVSRFSLSKAEEEDSVEEKGRLEDSLDAIEILKGYTSPWPVDDDGKPIVAVVNADDSRKGIAETKSDRPTQAAGSSEVDKVRMKGKGVSGKNCEKRGGCCSMFSLLES